jgi:hypothetical protein
MKFIRQKLKIMKTITETLLLFGIFFLVGTAIGELLPSEDEHTPKLTELQARAEHIDSTLHALHAKVDTLLYLQRFELNLMDFRFYEIDSLVNELKTD